MSGDKLFVDTNILLYFLNGNQDIIEILSEKDLVVSFISELELLSFPKITKDSKSTIKNFLKNCTVVELNPTIKTYAMKCRRKWNLKLPDAIIVATAMYYKLPLITADKDFSKVNNMEIILYEV
jgi:predicted nucleic acid-binding protein